MHTDDLLRQLQTLPEEAEAIAAGYTGGQSSSFASAEALTKAIHLAVLKLRFKDKSDIPSLYLWFAPTGNWDSIIGPACTDTGNKIFAILEALAIREVPAKPIHLRKANLWDWLSMLIQRFFD